MSNDWIEHTTDTCPVDPETVVEARFKGGRVPQINPAGSLIWLRNHSTPIFCYRIITPAKPAWLDDPDPGADPAKPPEPEMTNPEPDFIALRLECLKLAFEAVHVSHPDDWTEFADTLLHYVLNGSVDKA
jgi:hypothetical protein